MERHIKAAAIQMDVKPAPVQERLLIASNLVQEAVRAGAELVVLPELFNTGYAYSPENYSNAEAVDGFTMTWMQSQARERGIYLAGALLIKEKRNGKVDIRNRLVLFAPDGQSWHYDKNYPWSWEYAYTIPTDKRPKVIIAHTDIGDIGFLTCWDAAHGELWKAYAGKVDLMVLCSSPPDALKASLIFDNIEIGPEKMGKTIKNMSDEGSNIFVRTVSEQVAWLGVPAISAMPGGTFRSQVPKGRGSFLVYALSSPRLFKHMSKAKDMQLLCKMVPACRIVDAQGRTAAIVDSARTEGVAVAEILLADHKHQPVGRQPKPAVNFGSYFLADRYIPLLTRSLYRRAMKKQT